MRTKVLGLAWVPTALLAVLLAFAVPATADQADTAYDCTPTTYSATVTWYDNAPLGLSACHYSDATLPGGAAKANQYYAAIATHMYDDKTCGACAEITDSGNGRKVTVMVTDECPAASNPTHCSSGSNHLDISQNAFDDMEALSVGVFNVTWKVVPCPASYMNVKGQAGANMSYQFKSGASSGWATILVRDYPMPIRSLSYCTGSGTGCSAAAWQRSYNGWVPTGTWNTFYLQITDKAGNVGNFGPISCCTPVGNDAKSETAAGWGNVPAPNMPSCTVLSPTRTPVVVAGSPTNTPTRTLSPTNTPIPVDCPLMLNDVSTLTENGTWSGANASRSVNTYGGSDGAALRVDITTASTYNNTIANLAGFAPIDWTAYKRLTVDVYVDPTALPWSGTSTYHQLSLRATDATAGKYEVAFDALVANANLPLVSGLNQLSFPIGAPGGTSMSAAALASLDQIFFILNEDGQQTGRIYLDNITLHTDGACPSPTRTLTIPVGTFTNTRTMTPTITLTPVPADCPSLFNNCDTLAANGTWAGGNTTLSITTGGVSTTQGTGSLKSAINFATTFQDGMANLSAFAPSVLGGFKRLSVDVYVDPAAVPWTGASTYHRLALYATASSVAKYEVPFATGEFVLAAGMNNVSFTLSFPGGTNIATTDPVTILHFILNQDGPQNGNISFDNIVLHTDLVCPPMSPTPTATRTATITPSRTVTPAASATPTATQTRTPTPSSTLTLTPLPASATPTASPTRTGTPSSTSSATSSATRTVSPSSTITLTPVPASFTSTATLTRTGTGTFTVTNTGTATRTGTGTFTVTLTPVPASATPTASPTRTGTGTFTVTVSQTPLAFTATSTATRTNTSTNTVTLTPVPPTGTSTVTPTRTGTGTSSATGTVTLTRTGTITLTATTTNTPSRTVTNTPSVTVTSTPPLVGSSATATPTISATYTATPTVTLSGTRTASPSSTGTPSFTSTLTRTPTRTSTGTPVNTSTVTNTPNVIFTATSTPTITRTNTPVNTSTVTNTPNIIFTFTSTPTITRTNTLVNTSTVTNTPNIIFTSTHTPTVTRTNTPVNTVTVTSTVPVNTFTSTATGTFTGTPSRTATVTLTGTPTATRTVTVTVTSTVSSTPSHTPSVTQSFTAVPTNSTLTNTPTISPTFSFTGTATPTATRTVTGTSSSTASPINTPANTATLTVTGTGTSTRTASPSNTPVNTGTATFTPTATITVTATVTPTPALNPVLVSLSPNSVAAGSGFTLTLNGSNFGTTANLLINGVDFGALTVNGGGTSAFFNMGALAAGPYNVQLRNGVSGLLSNVLVLTCSPYTATTTPSVTSTLTALPAASGTPTFTATGTATATATGSSTVTPTATPTATGTITVTATASPTASVNPVLVSISPDNMPTSTGFSMTLNGSNFGTSAVLVVNGTDLGALSVSGGGSLATFNFGGMAAGSYTVQVRNATSGLTSNSLTLLIKAMTPTVTPTMEDGELGIHEAVAYPNPIVGDHGKVGVNLRGRADYVTIKIYTKALVCVGSARSDQQGLGAVGPGWMNMSLPPEFLKGASSGTYYFEVSASRGVATTSKNPVGKIVVIH